MACRIFTTFTLLLATAASLTSARPMSSQRSTPTSDHAESEHKEARGLGRTWYHADDHPAVNLFRRQDVQTSNGTTVTVGSPAWTNSYPQGKPDVTKMPQEWINALASAVAAGLIPNITLSNEGNYPSGIDPMSTEVCSSTDQCRGDGDIWDAPDGMLGVSFDDGPTEHSPKLYDFLKSQNVKATHFFIGEQILGFPTYAQTAFQNGDDLAVHTWTHRYMTGLTNAEAVAEFGYTMQIIADVTGGRVPKFWRPPYGDSDNRIRAIAKHIFGLTQVDWNQDTNDWQLGESNKVTPASIAADLKKWITGPKSPGLIILEHELSDGSVQAFIDAYPLMVSNNWDIRNIPDLFNAPWFTNSLNDNSTVTPLDIVSA
ncbi:hypothetical protein FRB90_000372, partial [Tulasnella sp. 427]